MLMILVIIPFPETPLETYNVLLSISILSSAGIWLIWKDDNNSLVSEEYIPTFPPIIAVVNQKLFKPTKYTVKINEIKKNNK